MTVKINAKEKNIFHMYRKCRT